MTSFDTTAVDLYLIGVLVFAAAALLLSLAAVTTALARRRRPARPRDVLRVERYSRRTV